jgi:predicted phosphohydrolase
MSIFAISDLHLALSIDKPMDVFGSRWGGYMDKIKTYWNETITDNDYVIIPGDISWATYLEQAVMDFTYIDSLPGRKIISKGNHDYWWTTLTKLEAFISKNGFSTISFMHNNSYNVEKSIICGTRGWKLPGDDEFSEDDRKIYNRELNRLEISLKNSSDGCNENIIVALHYPPFNSRKEASGFVDIMNRYNVNTCIYGHLHGEGHKNAVDGIVNGISFKCVAADYLKFRQCKGSCARH